MDYGWKKLKIKTVIVLVLCCISLSIFNPVQPEEVIPYQVTAESLVTNLQENQSQMVSTTETKGKVSVLGSDESVLLKTNEYVDISALKGVQLNLLETDDNYIVSGKINAKDIDPTLEKGTANIDYYFDKETEEFIKAEINATNLKDESVKKDVVKAISEDKNIEENKIDVIVDITTDSNITIEPEKSNEKIEKVDLKEQLSIIENSPKYVSKKITIDKKLYILNEPIDIEITEPIEKDTLKTVSIYKINYKIYNNGEENILKGVSSGIGTISYMGCSTEEEFTTLFGKPSVIGNQIMWNIKTNEDALIITINRDANLIEVYLR